jgi:hypothetical protein
VGWVYDLIDSSSSQRHVVRNQQIKYKQNPQVSAGGFNKPKTGPTNIDLHNYTYSAAAKFTLFHVNSREFTLFHTFSRDFT